MKDRILWLAILLALIAGSAAARTLKILAIGNSFSRDAIEQNLHELAKADGDTAIIGNLYIGGCSLERHASSIRDDRHDYVYRKIGADGIMVEKTQISIADALGDEQWDFISIQQASPFSGQFEKFEPYVPYIVKYVKEKGLKKSEIILHQTWAYQQSAGHSGFRFYDWNQKKMYRAIVEANRNAAKLGKIKITIPCGTAVQNARSSFIGDNMNRDGYHLDLSHGRFTAACTWYDKLFGRDVTSNPYFPEGMNPEIARIAKLAAHEAVLNPYDVTDLGSIRPDFVIYKEKSVPIEVRIDDLLRQMTLNEKVMQLNQYTLGRNDNANNVGETVGSIPAEVGSLIYFDTIPELRNAMQRRAMEDSRLGIPIVFGYDAIHGFRTIYPISLAQACSWNPELVKRACSVSAREARMSGIDWTFSPMIDVARDPRWGRVAEGYGEDPWLNSLYCAASVKGYQGENLADSTSVAACLKHYVGYGASEAGRDYVYTEISPQTLWDTYLPPYEAGVKAGAATLMSSFNDISGVPGSANSYTMTDVLKKRWKHDGFVVSDWNAIDQLRNQGVAADKKEAAMRAVNSGLEMDMMSHAYDRHLAELVAEGKVSPERVDDAVRRVLRVKMRLGLFDNPYTPEVAGRFLRRQDVETASELAAESMVLLKNDSTRLLPLKDKKRIAVVGPLADNARDLLGNWSGHGKPEDVVTLLEGIKEEFGPNAEVKYAEGCNLDGCDRSGFKEAVDAAKWADVVLLCIGESSKWSGENASRSSISLPEIQENLAAEISKTGTPMAILLANGRPLELCRLEPIANAILEIWQPGICGGEAAAGILSGRINPSGKLAVTFPYTVGQVPIYYNRRKSGRSHQGFYQDITSKPMYAFGHGLSYTEFVYGEPVASQAEFGKRDKVRITVPVTNNGDVAGAETVLWYVSDPYCSITRPEKELKHFEKIMLAPGQTAVAEFIVDPMRDLAYPNSDGERFLEPGEFQVIVNGKKVKISLIE